MVDDVLGVQKFGTKSINLNGAINTFMEAEKLTLSQMKCHQIHNGRNVENCPQLMVHKENMNKSDTEKYLGDQTNNSGKCRENNTQRKGKGFKYWQLPQKHPWDNGEYKVAAY